MQTPVPSFAETQKLRVNIELGVIKKTIMHHWVGLTGLWV